MCLHSLMYYGIFNGMEDKKTYDTIGIADNANYPDLCKGIIAQANKLEIPKASFTMKLLRLAIDLGLDKQVRRG